MIYQEFRRLRDDLLQRRRPLRLDCMNPERALASWTPARISDSPGPAAVDAAVAAWIRATGGPPPAASVVKGRGIRDLLAGVLATLRGRIRRLDLPQDVYPVYGELAAREGIPMRAFPTLSQSPRTFLEETIGSVAALLPIPLSPLGRYPRPEEIRSWIHWLQEDRTRWLIVDAAYTYDFARSRGLLEQLYSTDQAIVLWSASKPYLETKALGLAAVPEKIAGDLAGRVPAPEASSLGPLTAKLERRPHLPRLQQEAFDREWTRLAPAIRSACPDWSPPESGYFCVVNRPFRDLLDRSDLLGVPASVFGSAQDRTILTCLHDLAEHERE